MLADFIHDLVKNLRTNNLELDNDQIVSFPRKQLQWDEAGEEVDWVAGNLSF